MQSDLLNIQVTGDASFNPEEPDCVLNARRDDLLIAIACAEREGFLETHGALIEMLRIFHEETQRTSQ